MEYGRRYNNADEDDNDPETMQALADRIIDEYLNTTFVNNRGRSSTNIQSVFTPHPVMHPTARPTSQPTPIRENVNVNMRPIYDVEHDAYLTYMLSMRDYMSQHNQLSRTYLQMMNESYTSIQNRHTRTQQPANRGRRDPEVPHRRPVAETLPRRPVAETLPRRTVAETLPRRSNATMRNIYTTTIPMTTHRFENVVIRPTPEEVQQAVRQIVYDDAAENISRSCPITLEQFENGEEISQIIHCGHCFSQEALTNLFQSSVRCPVCRFDIRDTNPDPSRPYSRPRHNRDAETTTTDQELQANIENMVNTVTSLISEHSIRDISGNFIYSFEIPLTYYDLSSNLLQQNV